MNVAAVFSGEVRVGSVIRPNHWDKFFLKLSDPFLGSLKAYPINGYEIFIEGDIFWNENKVGYITTYLKENDTVKHHWITIEKECGTWLNVK